MKTELNRRQLLKLSAAGASVALTSGLSSISVAATRADNTLRLSVNITPGVLNPMLSRAAAEYMMSEMLYSGLTSLGTDMTAQPDLATEWSSNEDATQWRFTLHQGVKFSNGQELTSKDVVASFRKLLDPKTGAPGRRNLGPIKTVDSDGDYTVIVTTETPFADLPVALTYPTAKVVPADIIATDFDSLAQIPVGSGPFRLEEFRVDEIAILVKNPEYFVSGLPYLNQIEIKTFPDAAGSTAALLAGEIDMIHDVQPTDFARIDKASGVSGLRTPSGRFLDVVMDTTVAPFDNILVRQALSYCVDREAMIELVADGYGTAGNDSPINAAYRYYADAPHKSYDPKKAKALLAEAGYPNGLELELIASVKPGYRSTMAVVLREMAKAGGFDISVKTMDHSSYLDQVWKKGKFYVGFYNMMPTEGMSFNLLFTSGASWNETKWNNTTFDEYVRLADETTDSEKRKELYANAQSLMQKEVPALIPCFFDILGAKADYVNGYEQHPRGASFAFHKVWVGSNAPANK
ncbi:ABC transporter substrate-binding protein [Marinomonas ushuaiensis]|uniref:ABC transporter substrate-binding protein n=1 Tax=Marinomonas ushuaiensis TaxID=263818 RepID=UPI0004B7390C|nr:ABC transporter substrate-binding protein [Marinomonas ushuaiensis]